MTVSDHSPLTVQAMIMMTEWRRPAQSIDSRSSNDRSGQYAAGRDKIPGMYSIGFEHLSLKETFFFDVSDLRQNVSQDVIVTFKCSL